ncbi:peptidase M20 [Halobacteriales archaeon QS_8_69_26]|nr:MAG: peptidase M20 [Halobacteriales archaeon QS_8_69_26]
MDRAEVGSLTRELVAIPSHEDETAAGDRIEEWLRAETDAAVTRDGVGNVIARRSGSERTAGSEPDPPTLALVGHHDVVPPDESQVAGDEYRVEERDGRLYGRGTADMKGAVAAAMCAFRDADPRLDLVFASFVGEETGGEGARHAIDEGFSPDYAVVGEGSTGYSAPGVTDVAVAHKGRRGSTVVARGESAHASEPEAGVNAVYRACDAVDVLRELSPPSARIGLVDREVTGSLTVTGMEGGDAWNVIPDRCSVVVDERTVPGDRADLAAVEEIEGVEWTVDQDLPPMACDDRAFADAALAAAREAAGSSGDPDAGGTPEHVADEDTPQHVVKPHATDAGWLSSAGTECVVCGPARPGEAHTDDESVSLAVLERCYRIYRRIAESFDG